MFVFYFQKVKIENSSQKIIPVQKEGFLETACPKDRQDGSLLSPWPQAFTVGGVHISKGFPQHHNILGTNRTFLYFKTKHFFSESSWHVLEPTCVLLWWDSVNRRWPHNGQWESKRSGHGTHRWMYTGVPRCKWKQEQSTAKSLLF